MLSLGVRQGFIKMLFVWNGVPSRSFSLWLPTLARLRLWLPTSLFELRRDTSSWQPSFFTALR